MSANVSQSYLRNTILTASAEQLHLMLLDGAIRFAAQAQEALKAKNYEGMFNALDRAQRVLLELSSGLNRENNPSLVDQFRALYQFVYRRLVDANMNRDPAAIADGLQILRHQRETWQILMDKVREELAKSPAHRTPASPQQSVCAGNGLSGFVAEG
ncbi:MAG: flagellar export chaperone FliS [Phycisphaerae bacterium]